MKIIITFSLLAFSTGIYAQQMPDYGQNNVRLNDSGRSVRLQVIPSAVSKPRNDRTYYWYGANKIHEQQGGYSGKLLNGSYEEFYENKSLKEQGTFKNGLRNGEWKYWNENGRLQQVMIWNEGIPDGKFSVYAFSGKLVSNGRYANGKLDGDVIINANTDSVKTVRYKQGMVTGKKEHNFLKKINIFKHKASKKDSTIQKR